MALHHAQMVLGEENCICILHPWRATRTPMSPLGNTASPVLLNQLSLTPITVVSLDSWRFVTGRHRQTLLFEGAIWCTVCYRVVFVTAFEGGVTDKHKGMQSSRRVIHQCIRLVLAIVLSNIVCGCGEVEMSSVLFLLQYKCTLRKEISQNKVTDTPVLRTVLWLNV